VKLVYKQLITHQAQAFSHASTFELQRTLYQKGLAAEPLYFDSYKGIWIEAYLPADEGMLSTGDANQNTQRLIHALVNLHQARAVDYADDATGESGESGESDECGNGDIRRLDPFDHAEYLLAQIKTPEAQGIAKTLNLLRAEVQSTTDQNESWVLCHNDLHVAHVRSAQRCIDWEYAAIGPRYFDVAMCITINQICDSTQHAFINAYAQLTDTNPTYAQQQVACYLRLCAIINEIWEQVLHHKG
jgi:thiamine kinase-like enzyme